MNIKAIHIRLRILEDKCQTEYDIVQDCLSKIAQAQDRLRVLEAEYLKCRGALEAVQYDASSIVPKVLLEGIE